ncbi:unnamed protein product [Penicillium salamii]|nr:unnamed protein product [Penicillium salamii]CAG8340146.1 unnamed protein product [Penicillium salamii]
MPITGVYFVPSNPNASTALPQITERLRSSFPDEELTPVGRWGLEQKLLRDTPGLIPPQNTKPPIPRYMQFLSLSHYPTHGFVYTSEPEKQPPTDQPLPMVMTSVPPPAFATLFQHFTYACQPLWTHRLTLAVPNGVVYDVGDFRVRLGDVRQTFPTARVRGTVVEIEWRGPSIVEGEFAGIQEEDADAEYAATEELIREFWGKLGIQGREAILVPGVGSEVKQRLKGNGQEDSTGTDVARQFMEVLRFNR